MKVERQNVPSGGRWEPVIGYSRAVRVGPFVHVAGTTAADNTGRISFPGDPYGQARQALENIESALTKAGASLKDVVRTRIYLTNIDHWPEAVRAHQEVFGEIKPVNATLAVTAFVSPDMLVEIEAEAIISDALGA